MAGVVSSKVGLIMQQLIQQRKWLVVFAVLLLILFMMFGFRQSATDNTVEGTHHNQSDTFVSAIEPIELSQAKTTPKTTAQQATFANSAQARSVKDQRVYLEQQFQQASTLKAEGEGNQAAQIYQKLIVDYPKVVESYINLAKIQAEEGDLEKARVTLTSGLKANENVAVLYANLQQVHGAIAANAYHKVLDSPANTSIAPPVLTAIDTVDTEPATSAEVLRLRNQLNVLTQAQQKRNAQVEKLQVALRVSKQQLALARKSPPIASTVSQVDTSLSTGNTSTVATVAINKTEPAVADTPEVAAGTVANAVDNVEATPVSVVDDVAVVAVKAPVVTPAETPIKTTTQTTTQTTIQTTATANEPSASEQRIAEQKRQNDQTAEGLVKSWAKAWSDQNVDGYLRHYTSDYSPANSNLSHREWEDQRQVRLTNKKYIKVTVSNFEVVDMSDKFVVNFNQHYQSERINDRIKKQLVFEKEGSNWRDAKIIKEQVLRY